MKAKGKLRQLKFIYQWALEIIKIYENMGKPTDHDWDVLIGMVKKHIDESNDDEYCRTVLLGVLGAIEKEER